MGNHRAKEQKTNNIPVKSGELHTIKIERLGKNAEGIGKIKGFTVFVKNLLPKEEAVISIKEVKKSYAIGVIKQITKQAEARTVPLCPLYEVCGGCQMQHISYNAQLKFKREQVKDALLHIGNLEVKVHDTIKADDPWYYRNKMQFPVVKRENTYHVGCFSAKTHTIVDTSNCMIQQQGNNEILRAFKKIIQQLNLSAYDENSHRGFIRHIVGRVTRDNALMVAIVTISENFPQKEKFLELLKKYLPNIVSCYQNIQKEKTNVILGKKTKLLLGKKTIRESIGKLNFNISLQSFFQVNTLQAEKLYYKALELASLTGDEIIIDAYSGTGTIALFLAKKAKKVYGIEIVASAIENAKQNAKDNHIQNVEFILGDTALVMPKLYGEGIQPDIIILDPPRKGVDKKVLLACKNMNPQKIIYISCNPATLARDLAILENLDYKTREIFPLDMFPMTSHVECIALIQRVK